MIAYIKGKVLFLAPDSVVLDVGGLGYQVYLSHPQMKAGEELALFTYLYVREETLALYGFRTQEEREIFLALITVSGIGPKMATGILSGADSSRVREAITKGDTTILTAVSGVGPKLAAKIIVELKNKFSSGRVGYLATDSGAQDVLDALLALGYKRNEVTAALGELPSDLESADDKIRWVLKHLGKQR